MDDTIPQDTPQSNLTPKTTFIYVLIDPETNEVRYVGKTNEPQRRFEEHLYENPTTYKGRWVAKLRKRGLIPVMEIIEEVPFEIWIERELYWINHYLEHGHPLTNTYFGSAGVGMVPLETRAKMSATRTGRKMPPDAVARGAAKRRGRKASPETRAKISLGHKGQTTGFRKGMKHTPEAKAKMAAAKLGTKRSAHSEETKRKISEAQLGKSISPETRARLSASHKGQASPMKGRKQTPEARAKMSLAKKRAHAIRQNPPDTLTLWD